MSDRVASKITYVTVLCMVAYFSWYIGGVSHSVKEPPKARSFNPDKQILVCVKEVHGFGGYVVIYHSDPECTHMPNTEITAIDYRNNDYHYKFLPCAYCGREFK